MPQPNNTSRSCTPPQMFELAGLDSYNLEKLVEATMAEEKIEYYRPPLPREQQRLHSRYKKMAQVAPLQQHAPAEPRQDAAPRRHAPAEPHHDAATQRNAPAEPRHNAALHQAGQDEWRNNAAPELGWQVQSSQGGGPPWQPPTQGSQARGPRITAEQQRTPIQQRLQGAPRPSATQARRERQPEALSCLAPQERRPDASASLAPRGRAPAAAPTLAPPFATADPQLGSHWRPPTQQSRSSTHVP